MLRHSRASIVVLILAATGLGPAHGEEGVSAVQARAVAALAAGNADAAIPLFRKVLLAQPHNEPARYGLARSLLYARGGSDADYRRGLMEAARLLEQSAGLLEAVPGQQSEAARRLFDLGLALWYLDQGSKAMAAFDRALRLNPGLRAAAQNAIRVAEEMDRRADVAERKQTLSRIATQPR